MQYQWRIKICQETSPAAYPEQENNDKGHYMEECNIHPDDTALTRCAPNAHNTDSQLDMKPVNALKGYEFYIPSQQRGYRWTVKNIYELVEDLLDFRKSASHRYSLQPLAVVDTDSQYSVLDGQQRLTSIYILMKALHMDCSYSLNFERDANTNNSRKAMMENLDVLKSVDDETIDFYHISRAYLALKSLFDESVEIKMDDEDCRSRKRIIAKLNDSNGNIANKDWLKMLLAGEVPSKTIEFIWYLVPESESHKVFRNLNSGKIELSNSDLIKALLLSDNSNIPADKRANVASQFEDIQMAMKNDRLWHMLQWHEFQRNGYRMSVTDPKENPGYIAVQNRIDLIFNLIGNVSFNRYQSDALSSFRYYYDNREELYEIWIRTYKYYLLIKGLYDNPVTYHYCGVLTFFNRNSSASYSHIKKWLDWTKTTQKDKLIELFRKEIRTSLRGRKGQNYELPVYKSSNLEPVRKVLLLHNVETIISLYKEKNNDDNLRLTTIYEVFPFDLLYRQHWDIEHVSSQSDNTLKGADDRNIWAVNFKHDYRELFEEKLPGEDSGDNTSCSDKRILDFSTAEIRKIRELYSNYTGSDKSDDKKKAFDFLYQYVITVLDEHLKEEKITEKDCIGNLVLLDRHTNRSFHNALFPTKRRIILEANGGLGEAKYKCERKTAKLAFIPLCTRQVFAKHFSVGPGMSLSAWTKTDYDNYTDDIKTKLKYYIE